MEKLCVYLLLIIGAICDDMRDENRTKNVLIEFKEIMKTMKEQQDELLKVIDEQQEEFAHTINQLRIQMTQNYRKQKRDLTIAKRQIIKRNEKSVAWVIQRTADNVSDILDTLNLQNEQMENNHQNVTLQIQELQEGMKELQKATQESKTLEGTPTDNVSNTTSLEAMGRLIPAVMDLDVRGSHEEMSNPYRVAALPGGQAFVTLVQGDMIKVVKIDKDGTIIKRLHEFPASQENHYLLTLHDYVYVLHSEGNITKIHTDGAGVEVNHVDVEALWHSGSLSFNTSTVPNILLLSDIVRGEIFSLTTTSYEKIVRARNFASPASVSHVLNDGELSYMVLDEAYDKVIYLYNSSWHLVRSFGAEDLHHPTSAITTPEGTILITNYWKSRVTEFTTRGQFVRHVLTKDDGIRYPVAMSFAYPHLWVTYYPRRDAKGKLNPGLCDIKRFKIYEDPY